MLAKVPVHRLSPDVTPAPPSFTATFNPSPNPPATNQFFLTDPNAEGGPVDNLVLADDTTLITITLAEGSFSSTPIVWSLPQDGFTQFPPMVTGPNNNILTFTVPAPAHVLSPWAFRFIADVNGVNGVRSQTIYLARSLGTDPHDTLMYSADTGGFVLMADGSSQVGPVLGEELVLVNVYGSRYFSVSLENDPSSTSTPSLSFVTDSPIVWSSGEQPDWIHNKPLFASATQLDFHIVDDYIGHSIGLQFAITVTPEGGGETIKILSPDPILINTTIGDGG